MDGAADGQGKIGVGRIGLQHPQLFLHRLQAFFGFLAERFDQFHGQARRNFDFGGGAGRLVFGGGSAIEFVIPAVEALDAAA